MGDNPEKILSREAFADGNTTLSPERVQEHYLEVLGNRLREIVRVEAIEQMQTMKAVQSP
jgi:hypothetical protein